MTLRKFQVCNSIIRQLYIMLCVYSPKSPFITVYLTPFTPSYHPHPTYSLVTTILLPVSFSCLFCLFFASCFIPYIWVKASYPFPVWLISLSMVLLHFSKPEIILHMYVYICKYYIYIIYVNIIYKYIVYLFIAASPPLECGRNFISST